MSGERTLNYCLRNIDDETRRRLRSSEHHVVEDFCLQRCGYCYQGPFLVIDGELVTGGSHEEILARICRNDDD